MLDELDRDILTLLDRNSRSSSIELARNLKRSRQTIEYRIKRLEDRGIITGYTCSFNPTSVGYRLYKVYLRLRNVPGEKERLRAELFRLGTVYWIGETSGTWDLLFGIFYRDEREILSITDRLMRGFRQLIVAHSGHLVVGILQYPKMYLTGEIHPHREYAGTVRYTTLDELDVAIIAKLIADARLSFNALGEALGVSSLLVQRRMKRMEQSGTLFQYRIGLNLRLLGLELYKAIITTDFYSEEEHQRFVEFISLRKEIQFFVRNVFVIELELIVPHYDAYETIIDDIRREFPKLIGSLDTLLLESDEWTPAFSNL
jgi:DNA-binding Lrp family transcriptional regulator